MQQPKFVVPVNSSAYASTSNVSCELVAFLNYAISTCYHFHQNQTDCEIKEFLALSGNCNDDVDVGNSVFIVWAGSTTLGKIKLNSFTNISIISEDQSNNSLCQTFSKEMQDVLCNMYVSYLSLVN